MTGHDLHRELLNIHGVDRYPSVNETILKTMEELGELIQAILKNKDQLDVAKEYGDVGLCLFGLGNKLDLDLNECMTDVVAHETRKFIE